jgi:ATP phosphoribosyltransferase regulatory subunit
MTAIPPLLPEGLRDRLPDEAQASSRVRRALVDAMHSHGYARVDPAIAEFVETLSMGSEGVDALLRFTDPVSRRTLAIRPDITRQVARIAATRMADAPRPLRLAYAGSVVSLDASSLWHDREVAQVGAELIGCDNVMACGEIAVLALDALAAAGVSSVTLDLTLPDLVDTLAAKAFPLPPELIGPVKRELDAKDAGALAALGDAARAYLPLIEAMGPFASAVERLRAIDAGGALASRIAALEAVAARIGHRATVTLDPTERHGFEYQSWFGFSLFVTGLPMAVGRGGSYAVPHADGRNEAAVGVSLYPDPLIALGIGSNGSTERRLYLPLGHDGEAAATLRGDGWVTVAALTAEDNAVALGCTHRLDGSAVEPL